METIQVSNLLNKNLLLIHNEIASKIDQTIIDVFLCGAVSKNNNISIRDQVRQNIENIKSGQKIIRVLYPEELFIEILKHDKNSNLLTLENFLADNTDSICIICESAGALVELGAFSNDEKLRSKLIAALEAKRKKEKSFIMLGPIKLIQKSNKSNILYYTEDQIDSLSEGLADLIYKNNKNKKIKFLNTIMGLYYFIIVCLYFFPNIESTILINLLKNLFKKLNYSLNDFDYLFKTTLKILYKEKYIQPDIKTFTKTIIQKEIINGEVKHIKKDVIKKHYYYTLTSLGYKNVLNILYKLKIKNRTKLYDYIRFGIIKDKYYSCSS